MSVILYQRKPGITEQDEPFFYNGIYTGIKYQCVELARRYYLIKYGVLFQNVDIANDIFGLHMLIDFMSGQRMFWNTHLNISTSPRPVVGSLLIWAPLGLFEGTGHVAVVVNVSKNYVYIIEQNNGQGRRKLPVRDGVIVSKGLLGWKMPPS
jgi:glutathionylspermidine amidase/synthetase